MVARRSPGRVVHRHPGALPGPGGAGRGHGRPRRQGRETKARDRRRFPEAGGSLALPRRSPGPVRLGHLHRHHPAAPSPFGSWRRRHPGEPSLVRDKHAAQTVRLPEERTASSGDTYCQPHAGHRRTYRPSRRPWAKKLACGLAQLLGDEALRHRLSANALVLAGQYSPAAFVAGVARAYGHLSAGDEAAGPDLLAAGAAGGGR